MIYKDSKRNVIQQVYKPRRREKIHQMTKPNFKKIPNKKYKSWQENNELALMLIPYLLWMKSTTQVNTG